MTDVKFEVGKTYNFYAGGGHFSGLVVKRTEKTVTVKFSDEGTRRLHRLSSCNDAANVKPTTLRIKNTVVNREHAVTLSAGKHKNVKVEGFANDPAWGRM